MFKVNGSIMEGITMLIVSGFIYMDIVCIFDICTYSILNSYGAWFMPFRRHENMSFCRYFDFRLSRRRHENTKYARRNNDMQENFFVENFVSAGRNLSCYRPLFVVSSCLWTKLLFIIKVVTIPHRTIYFISRNVSYEKRNYTFVMF